MRRRTGAALSQLYQYRMVIVLVGLGGGLRLFKLGSQSLWYDELFQYWASRRPVPQLLAQVAADGQTPPLYYLVTHFWLDLAEWLLPGPLAAHPEFFLRLPSVVCATALLVVLYRFALNLFGPATAKLALLLWAINPLLVGYGQEGRAYSLALLLVALSFLFFWRLIQGQTTFQNWLLYIITAIGALYTHYYVVYPLLAQSLFVGTAWFYWLLKGFIQSREQDNARPSLKKIVTTLLHNPRNSLLLVWLIAQGLIILSFWPWLQIWFGVVRQTSAVLTVEAFNPFTFARRSFGWLSLGNVNISPRFVLSNSEDWAATLLLGLGLIGLFFGTKRAFDYRKGREWALLMLWFGCGVLGPTIGGQLVKLPDAPRYLIQAAPPLLLGLAWAVQSPESRVHNQKINPSYFILPISSSLLLLMLWGLGNYYFNSDYARPDWRGVLTAVATEAKPGDLLLGFPYHHFDTAQLLYLKGREWPERAGGWSFGQGGVLYFPDQRWGGYADFGEPKTAPSPDLEGDLARLVRPYRRIWVITYTDPTNAEVLGWLTTHYRAVAPRYFGPHQSLVLYLYEE